MLSKIDYIVFLHVVIAMVNPATITAPLQFDPFDEDSDCNDETATKYDRECLNLIEDDDIYFKDEEEITAA